MFAQILELLLFALDRLLQAQVSAVAPYAAIFVGPLRGLRQLLVELVERLAQAPDAFLQGLDVGIGDVLALAKWGRTTF